MTLQSIAAMLDLWAALISLGIYAFIFLGAAYALYVALKAGSVR